MSTQTATTTAAPQAPLARPASRPASRSASRIEFVGRYKGLLAALVVLIHTGITYGASGSWYLTQDHDVVWLKILTTITGSLSQSFVLGAFFFLSAYFLPRSLEKKGAGKLLADRLVRLGIPYVLYYFFANPLLVMAVENLVHGKGIPWGPYFGSGPLWFVEALFIFNLIYVVFTRIRRARAPFLLRRGIPSIGVILAYIAVAALLGFATRLFFPVGRSIHNQQLGFFPMYILLFAAGIKAGQEGWLDRLAGVRLRLWAPLAIVSVVALLPMMVVGGAIENVAPFLGGLTWQSAAYATWEAVVGTSLFITTIVLFARRRWGSGAVARSFGEASYGIYIFHAATIILMAIALWRVNLHPALKWTIVAASGVCIPWALSEGLKRLPGFSRIL